MQRVALQLPELVARLAFGLLAGVLHAFGCIEVLRAHAATMAGDEIEPA